MAKIVDKEVYKAVKAFNERLRYARNKYGEHSEIVHKMMNEAKQVVALDWTKGNKSISLSEKNQKALEKAFQRAEFNKYVANNSAKNLLDKTIYTNPKYAEELKHLKGAERARKEEEFFAEMNTVTAMYEKIWQDVYDYYGGGVLGREMAQQAYAGAISGEHNDAIIQYANDKISIGQLIVILTGGGAADDFEEDMPSFYDFVNGVDEE